MRVLGRLGNWLLVLIAALSVQPAMAQLTGDAKNIPSSAFGTWDLTMANPPAGSLYAKDTTARLTIAIDGALCGDGIYIAKPSMKAGDTNRVYWSSTSAKLEFSVSTSSTFAGVQVSSYNGTTGADLGTFTSSDGKRSAEIDSSCDPNSAFFTLAQQNYPELFPGGVFALIQFSETEFAIYYALTDTWLVIRNGIASARGGKFGTELVSLGSVASHVKDGVKNLPIPVAATPKSFDSYYVGTYDMTLQNAAVFSPVPSGTKLKVVITRDYHLCAGETVIETPLLQSDANRVIWKNTPAGFFYSLTLLADANRDSTYSQGSIDLYSTTDRKLGTFTGNRTSLSAECADASGTNPDLAEINLMFDLAEQRLPELFPGGPLTFNQQAEGVVYRYYEKSGITVKIKSRQVTLSGGKYGSGVDAGRLDNVITALRSSTMQVKLPSSLTGTYALKFTGAGSFSPIASGASVDAAITDDGNLCMDGTLYTNPVVDLTNLNLVSWRNNQTGLVVQVDTTVTGNALSLKVQDTKNNTLGTLAGSKTLLLAKCAGLISGNIKLDSATQLFSLAETYYPGQFPPSALTYNQLSNGTLKRYYPATGVMIAVTGDTVTVSGGTYGTTPRELGKVDALINQLQPVTSRADLAITGEMQFKQGILNPIKNRIALTAVTDMPKSTTQADLIKLVQQQFGQELTGSSTYTFNIVTNTASKLEFNAAIANTSSVASSNITRNYTLFFSYSKK